MLLSATEYHVLLCAVTGMLWAHGGHRRNHRGVASYQCIGTCRICPHHKPQGHEPVRHGSPVGLAVLPGPGPSGATSALPRNPTPGQAPSDAP